MIAGGRFGFPEWLLRCQQPRDLIPIVEIVLGNRLAPSQAGGMAHQMADFYVLLAVGGKFRPITCHWRIEIKFAAIGENERRQRRHCLCRGIDIDDCVLGPGTIACLIRKTAPQVDNGLTSKCYAEESAKVCSGGKVVRKNIAHSGEPIIHKSFNSLRYSSIIPFPDRGHAASAPSSPSAC